MPYSYEATRGLNPRGHAPDRGATRTVELDDFAKVAPADGQAAMWDQTRKLWVPRAILAADVVGTIQVLATAPTATEGKAYWDTDDDQFLIYNGVAWRPPWNVAWGIVGLTSDTDGATFNGTETTIMSLVVTAVANRRYRLASFVLARSGGLAFVRTRLKEGATEIQLGGGYVQGASENAGFLTEVIFTPTAGSHTYTCTCQVMTGSTAGVVDNAATFPSQLYLEDCGPNGAAA